MDKISNSVGRHGVNKASDTRIVQTLLNRHIIPPSRILEVNGIAGSKTITAILAFQHSIGMTKCDGRVDPAGRTFSALCSLPKSVPLTEKILDSFSNFSKMLGKMGNSVSSSLESFVKPASTQSSQPVKSLPMIHLPSSPPGAIAWGAKVSPEFKKRVVEICKELGINPDYLMTCMALETGERFTPDVMNKDSKAIGLVQFTKIAINDINIRCNINPKLTREILSNMTAIDQLEYVRLYLLPYKNKVKSLEDIYMVILCPAAVGKGLDRVVYEANGKLPKQYIQNIGLDIPPRDGKITVKECSVVLVSLYNKGLSKGYFG